MSNTYVYGDIDVKKNRFVTAIMGITYLASIVLISYTQCAYYIPTKQLISVWNTKAVVNTQQVLLAVSLVSQSGSMLSIYTKRNNILLQNIYKVIYYVSLYIMYI